MLIIAVSCILATRLLAVTPNSLFTDNAVFQRAVDVPVWGTGENDEKITVEFADQKLNTTVKNGKWMVKLHPMKENSMPQNLIIKGKNTVTIKNILIGEVWLCSGQSNMAFPLRAVKAFGNYPKIKDVLKDAQNYPLVRQYRAPLVKNTNIPSKVDDSKGKWSVCDSVSSGDFSAVAYFMAVDLFKRLNVPIGIVNSSYGGTAIENWISMEALDAIPTEKSAIMSRFEKEMADYPNKLADFQNNFSSELHKFKTDSTLAVLQNKELPRKPTPPMSPAERGGPSGLWNTMIYPLIPYAFKGVVWYQGEANASRGLQYRTLLPALIKNWRKEWGFGDFPFVIVQIPGWRNHSPELKEAQLLTTQKTSNTALVVTYDCDDTLDVHPGNKQPVGERMALAARGIAYGDIIEFSGPVYKSMKVVGNKAILTFTHTGSGLISKNGSLKDFSIAGSDKKFVPAKAEIVGNKVVVSAESVSRPVAVRAGWRLCPQMNLYNKENLPASPFRTDIE